MSKSSSSKKGRKPPKPRADFPLYPHLSEKWAKTIRGRTYYFGKWDDPNGALAEYMDVKDELSLGRTPQTVEGIDLRELCNAFMKVKQVKLDTGKLSPRTFVDYDRTCRALLDEFKPARIVASLRPMDFTRLWAKLSHKYGVSTLGREITMIRSVFKYAYEMDLIDKPVKFGPDFKVPTKPEKRKAKAQAQQSNGKKLFAADEICRMIDAADIQLRAMILLGINGGLGNTDCANLPLAALDLDGGWLNYARPKSGVDRRIPLWPESVEALREVIAKRRRPRDPADSEIVFITKYGGRWVRFDMNEKKTRGKPLHYNAIGNQVAKLLNKLGLKRPGIGFYALRHTFRTVADKTTDFVACRAVMGHIDSSIDAEYVEEIDDDRLQAVVNYVHEWLFS